MIATSFHDQRMQRITAKIPSRKSIRNHSGMIGKSFTRPADPIIRAKFDRISAAEITKRRLVWEDHIA